MTSSIFAALVTSSNALVTTVIYRQFMLFETKKCQKVWTWLDTWLFSLVFLVCMYLLASLPACLSNLKHPRPSCNRTWSPRVPITPISTSFSQPPSALRPLRIIRHAFALRHGHRASSELPGAGSSVTWPESRGSSGS